MGYAWSGVCYSDANSVLTAFTKQVAMADSSGIVSVSQAPTISAGGVLSWSVSRQSFDGSPVVIQSGTLQLSSCAEDFGQWPVTSILFVVSIFFAAMLGLKMGMSR